MANNQGKQWQEVKYSNVSFVDALGVVVVVVICMSSHSDAYIECYG